MKFLKYAALAIGLLLTPTAFAEQAKEGVTYGGQVDEFVKDAIKNQLTISILRGDEYTEFKNASIAHFGAELATPPDNLATIAHIPRGFIEDFLNALDKQNS
jgi:hypothetical protein